MLHELRPFGCPMAGCHRRFPSSALRDHHLQTHHGVDAVTPKTPSNSFKFECEVCSEVWICLPDVFAQHVELHFVEVPDQPMSAFDQYLLEQGRL